MSPWAQLGQPNEVPFHDRGSGVGPKRGLARLADERREVLALVALVAGRLVSPRSCAELAGLALEALEEVADDGRPLGGRVGERRSPPRGLGSSGGRSPVSVMSPARRSSEAGMRRMPSRLTNRSWPRSTRLRMAFGESPVSSAASAIV